MAYQKYCRKLMTDLLEVGHAMRYHSNPNTTQTPSLSSAAILLWTSHIHCFLPDLPVTLRTYQHSGPGRHRDHHAIALRVIII